MTQSQQGDNDGQHNRGRGGCRGCLGAALLVFDVGLRVALAAIVLVFLIFAGALLAPDAKPQVKPGVALVVAPEGLVVEELSGDPLERALGGWLGEMSAETPLRDLRDAIVQAADDDDIAALVLDLDSLLGAGPSKLLALGQALDRFAASGKPMFTTADLYTRTRYQLAAHAGEVYLDDMGAVLLDGYSVYRTYMRQGLDRLGIDWNVFRVGTYKSAVEPYLRDDMSPAAKAANQAWLGDLWDLYLDDVSKARGIAREALEAYAREPIKALRAAGGDTARAALDAGLVDHIGGRDLLRARLIELVGENDDHSFEQITHDDYLAARGHPRDSAGDAVGVIVAQGTIVPGDAPAGTIGGDSMARLVRQAHFDERIKAVVLRIDSGGGSAFASEVVRKELALLKQAGKPVVVSMSSVAASGGYWIALTADEIWASKATLTGSIGIFAFFPTAERPLAEFLGMHVDGVGTTPLAGRLRPDMALPEAAAEGIKLGVEHGYRQFIDLVATARGKSPEAVESLAGGRVWSGVDAAEAGLVDHLGGLDEAIAAAAVRAELPDDYAVRYIEHQPSAREQMLISLLTRASGLAGLGQGLAANHHPRSAIEQRLDWLRRLLEEHAELTAAAGDPRGLLAHCLCRVE